MDLIQRAQAKREQLRNELARIEAFLATAFELEQDFAREKPADRRNDAEKADAPVRRGPSPPRSGVGKETLDAAAEVIRQFGSMSTRDMLPFICAKGIDVGGKDPVATLSARLSGKGVLEVYHGKWRFIEGAESSGTTGNEEAADNPTKDQSAASLFTQAKENDDAAALTP